MHIGIRYLYATMVALYNFGVTWFHHSQGEVKHCAVKLITNFLVLLLVIYGRINFIVEKVEVPSI